MKLYTKELNENNFVIYISKTENYMSDDCIAHISFVFIDDTVFVASIYVDREYRNKGYGTYLFNKMIDFSYDYSMEHVELDAMTRNRKRNLFTKCGMVYCSRYGPEMKGSVKDLII